MVDKGGAGCALALVGDQVEVDEMGEDGCEEFESRDGVDLEAEVFELLDEGGGECVGEVLGGGFGILLIHLVLLMWTVLWIFVVDKIVVIVHFVDLLYLFI